MSKTKARRSRAAGAAKQGTSLNDKAAIIVALISLVGALAASVISNWDKLRGTQAPDTTGDLMAYNEQRRPIVEGGFDQALGYLREAEEQATGQDADAIRRASASIREKKAAMQRQYDKVFEAIKNGKPVLVEVNKTELNAIIVSAQKRYDDVRVTGFTITQRDSPLRGKTMLLAEQVRSRNALPSFLFPVGRERHKPLEFITPAETACVGKPTRPAGFLAQHLVVAQSACENCGKGQIRGVAEY